MKTIYKYELNYGKTVIDMPEGARVVHFGMAVPLSSVVADEFQGAYLYLWAEVDLDMPEKRRTFNVYGTGMSMHGTYIASCFDNTFPHTMVWHLYE
jgi:hypothetical protein